MNQETKRVAAIHDLSGVGRCSLTVISPILSAMGVQCCPVPTAILSTHTGGFGEVALGPDRFSPAGAGALHPPGAGFFLHLFRFSRFRGADRPLSGLF